VSGREWEGGESAGRAHSCKKARAARTLDADLQGKVPAAAAAAGLDHGDAVPAAAAAARLVMGALALVRPHIDLGVVDLCAIELCHCPLRAVVALKLHKCALAAIVEAAALHLNVGGHHAPALCTHVAQVLLRDHCQGEWGGGGGREEGRFEGEGR
jgi:hypothetical protein